MTTQRWIADNYELYRQRVIASRNFDPDAFHDALLILATQEAQTWDSFADQYRQNIRRTTSEQMRFVYPEPVFWDHREAEESEPEDEPPISLRNIQREVKLILSKADYQIFKLKYELEMPLREIAMYTEQTLKEVAAAIQRIITRIKNYFNPEQSCS